MSPYIAQRTLPRFDESKRCASFYDLQARSHRAEKWTECWVDVSMGISCDLPSARTGEAFLSTHVASASSWCGDV